LHGDNNASIPIDVGACDPKIKKIIEVTREARDRAIKECKPGVKFSKIGAIIETFVNKHGFYIVKELTGHGIN